MITYSRHLVLLTAAIALCGCSDQPKTDSATPAKLEHAPDVYKVKFETSKGDFVAQINKEWAPLGAERLFQLVQSGFYDQARFFRVLPGFMVQFGINADPKTSALWQNMTTPDDPVKQSNTRGRLPFAKHEPGTPTTQVCLNYADNSRLNADGFAPLGQLVRATDVVDKIYT